MFLESAETPGWHLFVLCLIYFSGAVLYTLFCGLQEFGTLTTFYTVSFSVKPGGLNGENLKTLHYFGI